MFSGIVEESACVESVRELQFMRRITVRSPIAARSSVGDSICVDGVCLTVASLSGEKIGFDVGVETLRRTTLGSIKRGDLVHLEQALKVGDKVSGHFVTGHVDCVSELLSRVSEGENLKLVWSIPKEVRGLIAHKGSVALAGVSLTTCEVTPSDFAVYLIPHTLEVTKFSSMNVGSRANLEVDILARYVFSLLSVEAVDKKGDITIDMLKKCGFYCD
ncbi:MAG: riboflavin synthase [Candidatus Dadabacteria bacterium]|nr:MAG: riboflavin synthase [Candidatus Dadabacteria bacterium]